MTDTWPEGVVLPILATTECPHCAVVVPSARYCGACGSDLTAPVGRGPQRLHSYAAFPDEPVLRISVVTSLFPHLSEHARTPFRVAFGVLVALVIAFSLAGATGPLVAVCSLGVALLFLLYVFEVDPYEETFVTPTLAAFVVGAGLGVGWALIGGHQVDRALLPSSSASLTSGPSVIAAIVVPVVAELLMCLPIVAIWLLQRASSESLDGFVVGATSAVGFTAAATVVLLAPWFSHGQSVAQSFIDNLAAAIVRGVTFPLLSAMVTGLIGATIWVSVSGRSPARGRWLTSPVPALVLALAVQVGSAYANLAALPNAALVIVQIGAVMVGIVIVRIGLHHVLVHEAQGETVGPPRVCAHCNHLVPVMTFCPQCGIAERSIPRWRRLPHWHLGVGPGAPVTAPERAQGEQ